MKRKYLLVAATSIMLIACRVGGYKVEGNGTIITKEFNQNNFDEVLVEDNYQVNIEQGNDFKVLAETDENLLQYVEVSQKGEILRVKSSANSRLAPSNERMKINITMPVLTKANISGASELNILKPFKQEQGMRILLRGACSGKVHVEPSELSLDLSGASELYLKGEAERASISVFGASDLKGFAFKTNDTNISASGASSAAISATDKLFAKASGASNIEYKEVGKVNLSTNSSGASSVKRVD